MSFQRLFPLHKHQLSHTTRGIFRSWTIWVTTLWTSESIAAAAAEFRVAPVEEGPAQLFSAHLEAVARDVAAWAANRQTVTLVVPDATRMLPPDLVAACLVALDGCDVTVVVGAGLHRPPTDEEWHSVPHLREANDPTLGILDSGGQKGAVYLRTVDGARIAVNWALVKCDGIVVVGAVELHQYAGFSGGIKGLAVGCAAPETIDWIHRPALLNDPGVRVGRIDGNPFREQLDHVVRGLPPILEVQSYQKGSGQLEVSVGESPSGWSNAVAALDCFVDVPHASAAVVGMLGPKGQNLYQASRGVTQLVLQERSPLVHGAPVVLVTEAPDGLGVGSGENNFAKLLKHGRDRLLERLRSVEEGDWLEGGSQRAFMVALASERHPVGYISIREAPELRGVGWQHLKSVTEARRFLGTEQYLSVPDPIHRLPRGMA